MKTPYKAIFHSKISACFMGLTMLLLLSQSSHAANFTILGYLPGGDYVSKAYGVSADGNSVAAYGSTTDMTGSRTYFEAAKWTPSGMVGLSHLDPTGEYPDSRAWNISGDGKTVVGYSNSVNGQKEAFKWTASGGMVPLGDLPGGDVASIANAVSADGSTVVGVSDTERGERAFVWTEELGMVKVEDLLIDAGIEMGEVVLAEATAVSADGLTIVGYTDLPGGVTGAWMATLDPSPVPVPTSVLLLLSGMAGLAGVRKNHG